MFSVLYIFLVVALLFGILLFTWSRQDRRYQSNDSVASAYDDWTNDRLLERLWGDHIHLGFYENPIFEKDFRKAKVDLVHELVAWCGFDKLPKGSRILDVGCGIGGSARILARDYGFEVLGISISPAQVKRAVELTPQNLTCDFQVMDALALELDNNSFDGVWSVEAGPHMPDKQKYADELLRVLRPGGFLAVADWNSRDTLEGSMNSLEKLIVRQLLNQWAHPAFSSINGFRANLLRSSFCQGYIETADWTAATLPSWMESIWEGFRRPEAILGLGPKALFQGLREIPTILMMRWAFARGLMKFGVFRMSSCS